MTVEEDDRGRTLHLCLYYCRNNNYGSRKVWTLSVIGALICLLVFTRDTMLPPIIATTSSKDPMCSYYNWERCRDLDTMSVYAYPRYQHESEPDEWWNSWGYWKVVREISDDSNNGNNRHKNGTGVPLNITLDPNQACVLISDVNSMCQANNCRGKEHSKLHCLWVTRFSLNRCKRKRWIDDNKKNDVLRRLTQPPRSELWDHGRNHFLINMHDDHPIRLEKAMLLDGGTHVSSRQPQDIAFALGPRKKGSVRPEDPPGSKYLLSFKGTRYGPGTIGVREHLSKLHDPENGIIMCLQCRWNHGPKGQEQCVTDSLVYDQYDYDELMQNSSFSLIPRGQGLGSYRLTEAMSFGAIPVILADDLELPFPHLFQWSDMSLKFNENEVEKIPEVLRSLPEEQVLKMRQEVLRVYHAFFSTNLRMLGAAVQELHDVLADLEPYCR